MIGPELVGSHRQELRPRMINSNCRQSDTSFQSKSFHPCVSSDEKENRACMLCLFCGGNHLPTYPTSYLRVCTTTGASRVPELGIRALLASRGEVEHPCPSGDGRRCYAHRHIDGKGGGGRSKSRQACHGSGYPIERGQAASTSKWFQLVATNYLELWSPALSVLPG